MAISETNSTVGKCTPTVLRAVGADLRGRQPTSDVTRKHID